MRPRQIIGPPIALTATLAALAAVLLALLMPFNDSHTLAVPIPSTSARVATPSATPSALPACQPNDFEPYLYTLETNKSAGRFALGPALSRDRLNNEVALLYELKRRLCGDVYQKRGPDPILHDVVDMVVNHRDPNLLIDEATRRQKLEQLVGGIIYARLVDGADVETRYTPYVEQRRRRDGLELRIRLEYAIPNPGETFLEVGYLNESGLLVKVYHREFCGGQPYAGLTEFPQSLWPR